MDNNTKSEVQYTDAVFSKDKKTRTRTNFKPTINRTTRKRRGTAGNTNILFVYLIFYDLQFYVLYSIFCLLFFNFKSFTHL